MASSEKDPDEGDVAPSATAATDEVDSGWGSEAPPVQASKSAEEPGDAKESPETTRVESPPAESPPAPPPPAPPPPVEASSAAAPSLDVHFDEPTLLAAFWGARPSTAWLAVGGGAIVLALVVGILTGRGSRSEPEAASPAPSSSAPALPAVVAPAPAPAPSAAEPGEAPSAASSASPAAPKHAGAAFNAKAAKLAIDKIVPGLKTCKQAGEPPGQATVTVTFAPTGRVSDARVTTTRYAGTRTGTCVTQRLRQARIPEFVGSPVTVKRSVAIR